MPVEPKLSKTEDIEKRYSYSDIVIQGVKKLDFSNEEEFSDFMNSFLKSLTETEQKILEILSLSSEAITMSEIRNLLTEAYLHTIFRTLSKRKSEVEWRVWDIANFYIERNSFLLEYPNNFHYNVVALEEFTKDFVPKIKSVQTKQGLKKFFLEREVDKTMKETRTERSERARKLLSKYGFIIPSGESIKSSLEFLKEKNLVSFRIQNNNYLWFLEPKFNMNMRKLERIMNKRVEKLKTEIKTKQEEKKVK